MPPGVLLSHPSSLDHDTGAHPERAARLAAVDRALRERDFLGWEHRASEPVVRDVLEAVHPAEHIDAIERFSWAGGAAQALSTRR